MRVDCDDCSLNFQTKKLYIKHIKSKECTKSKRTKSPVTLSGQPSKKPRLEIIPQASYSPANITEIQSQISALTQKQKEELQKQLSQKHKVLQSIPLNQLASRVSQPQPGRQNQTSSRVIITKNGERREIVAVGPGLSVTPTSGSKSQTKPRRTYSRNSSSVSEVRREEPKDDLPLITEFTFSDEPIAAADTNDDDDDDISIVPASNPLDEGEPVSYGLINIKAFSKAFLNISNIIQTASSGSSSSVAPRSQTPTTVKAVTPPTSSRPITPTTATLKETCPYCRKIFRKSGMSQHIEYKHKSKCDYCDKRYDAEELQAHLDREHKADCNHCLKKFLTHELSNHVDSVHMAECRKCKQKYKKTEIEDHVRNTHEREACLECPQRFETKELLEHHNFEEHLVEHCEECPERFKEVEQLVDHSVTEHPKEQCPECESVFGLAKDLDEHKEKEHSKIMKFNGGMFMMMMTQDEDDDMDAEEENGEDTEEKERRDRELQEEERQRNLQMFMENIVQDLADDIVKNSMTGTILFALRFDT